VILLITVTFCLTVEVFRRLTENIGKVRGDLLYRSVVFDWGSAEPKVLKAPPVVPPVANKNNG